MQSIKSFKFNSLEMQLLAKQVKIINSRLNDDWEYLGEGVNADIVLSKNEIEVSVKSKLVLVQNKRKDSNHPSLDLPIRLMQLMNLLKNSSQAFDHISESPNNRSTSLNNSTLLSSNANTLYKLISETDSPILVLECLPELMVVDTKNNMIRHNFDSLPKLVQCLSETRLSETDHTIFSQKKNTPLDANLSLAASTSTKKLLWQLAKTEKNYSEASKNDIYRYKLSTWPTVKEWDKSQAALKLALLFSRYFTSIEHASRFCSIEPVDVKIFLHCCESIGITVLQSKPEDSQPEPIQRKVMIENTESLGWLHKKIKGFLNYGN